MLMQIWMPSPDLKQSAQSLSLTHLKRNYHTANWLVKYLGRATGAAKWAEHPARALIIQYGQHVDFLHKYRDVLEYEWISARCLPAEEIGRDYLYLIPYDWTLRHVSEPWWLGTPDFHNSHKSALLALDYIYYGRMDWDVPLEVNPWWPSAKQPTNTLADPFVQYLTRPRKKW